MTWDRTLDLATFELLRRFPDKTAVPVLTPRQRAAGASIVALGTIGLLAETTPTLVAMISFALALGCSATAHRLVLCARGLPRSEEAAPAPWDDDDALPVYTVLVPLYREAAVVGGLLEAIRRLDYPPGKLDVKLLVEADDEETIAALAALDPGPPYELVVVPDAQPKTKPKACNYGLAHARGDYVVIFDAEDRPEPDQLRKAVAAFRSAPPHVRCFQAHLNYWNRTQNLLTRWFTCEYSQRFDLFLPGLASTGAPIPLGGTSNHLPIPLVRELGGWDPFNVTEDADLGFRLARAGYRTCVLDSTTYEEANSRLGSWVRQRSRWIKGLIQCWLVLTRRPLQVAGELGATGWVHCQLLTAGSFVPLFVNPVLLALLVLWGTGVALLPSAVYLAIAAEALFSNAIFVALNVVAVERRGFGRVAAAALLYPVYRLLMSAGAWRGLVQLVTRPSYWEKTPHGLAEPEPAG